VPVYACESEKVCDKLAALGLIATCHATSWSKTDVEPLRGRKLRLLVDNDVNGAGENVAAKALDVLSPFAASIRVVRGGPPSGNLADRIDDEITVEEFEELCAKIPETSAQAQAPNHDGEIELHWECMADVEAEPVDWLWAGRRRTSDSFAARYRSARAEKVNRSAEARRFLSVAGSSPRLRLARMRFASPRACSALKTEADPRPMRRV
jgi:hypothetical protein